MKWIDSTDLRTWANKRDCQENLPLLVRKLIRATSTSVQSIHFPSGDNVLIGGWDGILKVLDETEYLPKGTSLWEFGSNKDPKGKADDDYDKRKKNTLSFNASESTFIFVTPQLWKKGEDWANEKKKERFWKDVKVINAETLEEWIEIAPTVGSWLAKHIGKYPNGGIQPADDFWEEWVTGTKFKLNSEILLGGRQKAQENVIKLINAPSVNAVQGISREESLAFILSCFKNNLYIEEDFFSRSIIVDNADAFRELSIHDKPLILIPRFEDNGVVNRAVSKGHTVIIPLGADSTDNWSNKIVLPRIERDAFVVALAKTGMTKEFAEKYSKESARNITILRRQLEFTRTFPEWALPQNVSDIIPALLVGRWNDDAKYDREIISKLARDSYENYIKKLTRWQHIPDSPIVKIGSLWRLTSPFDAWTNASKYLTSHDLELLRGSAIEILLEVNPALELPIDQRYMASLFKKERKFSSWIREGVTQSLILTSVFGEKLSFDLPIKADLWVDKVITEILDTNNADQWKSFESLLPLIAEASPIAFLNALEKYLSVDDSPIVALFEEGKGLFNSQSYHTRLLWALENLAWLPEYLSRTALILAKLSTIDPGGQLSNRPINSLSEIFKSWHHQTLAPFDERMNVLKLISKREPQIAWTILNLMLPNVMRDIAHPIHKMRWRMFDIETEIVHTWDETYKTYSAVLVILMTIFDFSETKLATLIEKSFTLSIGDREKLLNFLEPNLSKVKQVEYIAWHTVRKNLSHHRTFPKADWALPESILARYQNIYELLSPKNEVDLVMWMFDKYPQFVEGQEDEDRDYEKREKILFDRRLEALNRIKKLGLDNIIELSKTAKEPWILGNVLSHIVYEEDEIIKLCDLLQNQVADKRFIQSFLLEKCLLNGLDWSLALFKKLKTLNYSNDSLVLSLSPLIPTQELWNFIEKQNAEITEGYWKNLNLYFYRATIEEKIYGINKLIEYKRFFSAISVFSSFIEEIPSELIVKMLQKAATEKAEEQMYFDDYKVNLLFEAIDNRNDVDFDTIVQLEWYYLYLLASYSNDRTPKRLHDELSHKPDFFMEVLRWVYKPDDESKIEEEKGNLTDEQIINRAEYAYKLLNSWKKIPGVGEDGSIDNKFLTNWVSEVRKLAVEYSRVTIADVFIGKILAQYPEEKDKVWPPNEICELIERLNSDTLNRNFSSATFNKRGYSVRGVFDGGDIERMKAEYFYKLAAVHRNKYPRITGIFEGLAKSYENDAKRVDEDAERKKLEH